MIEALFLILLVGGIVYAAHRYTDIEERLFGRGHSHAPAETEEVTKEEEPVAPEVPADEATSIAKGFMRKKEISAEPEVEAEDLHKIRGEAAPAAEPTVSPDTAEAPEVAAEPVAEVPAEPTPAPTPKRHPKPEPKSDSPVTPGAHVTGTPARPSEPAYVNAAADVSESVQDLAAEADQAYRERDYERAEQACLKILMREPRNHKYMTRIGQIYQEMGNLEDAKEAYESAKKLDQKNFFVLNRLAEVERQLSEGVRPTTAAASTEKTEED